MPKDSSKNNTSKMRSPGRQPPSRAGLPSWWPVLAALVVIGAAIVALMAHLRTPVVVPSPEPSVLASRHFPSQGHQGHAPGDTKRFANFHYSSDPPTSGYHLERFPGRGFINDAPIPKYVQVHLLEHGNILLQYNCLCPDVVNDLIAIADEFNARLIPAGVTSPSPEVMRNAEEQGLAVIVAPYPSMPYTIAVTAWTRLATMDTVNKADIVSFINRWMHDPDNLQQ